MPPHVTGKVVKDNRTGTATFKGYSFEYASDKDIQISDLTTGKRVPHVKKQSCNWINNCSKGSNDKPGCWQQRCELSLMIKRPVKGHRYRIRFLDREVIIKIE